jgi:hypothetical protein
MDRNAVPLMVIVDQELHVLRARLNHNPHHLHKVPVPMGKKMRAEVVMRHVAQLIVNVLLDKAVVP